MNKEGRSQAFVHLSWKCWRHTAEMHSNFVQVRCKGRCERVWWGGASHVSLALRNSVGIESRANRRHFKAVTILRNFRSMELNAVQITNLNTARPPLYNRERWKTFFNVRGIIWCFLYSACLDTVLESSHLQLLGTTKLFLSRKDLYPLEQWTNKNKSQVEAVKLLRR